MSMHRVSPWRHVRAIATLPFMNTVVIPTAVLAYSPPPAVGASVVEWLARLGGLALLCAGVALVVHSIRLFVRRGEGTLAPWDPTRALVSEGAYRVCRNPMKAGLFVVLAGEALLFASVAIGAWLAVFALVNVIYIRLSEEPGLRARFGAPYQDYCERVPRWIPRLEWRPRAAQENG